MSKKSTLAKHLQMLRCFASAYHVMKATNKHSLYEAHLLYVDEFGLFYKYFRYFVGNSILPDSLSEGVEDVYITLLTQKDINHLLDECKKYGIKTEPQSSELVRELK